MAILRAYYRSLLKTTLKWACFCFIISLIFLHVSVKFWLGPAYVAMRIQETLAGFWSGPVQVGEIDFGYDGIMFVSDISFYDRAGTEVIKANKVGLVLGNWPSLAAPAKRIEVERLDLRLRLEDGKLNVPVRTSLNSGTGSPNLDYMGVKSATVRVKYGGSETVFDRLFAEVSKNEGLYILNIDRHKADDFSLIQVKGVFDLESGSVEMKSIFAHRAEREQMKALLTVLGVPATWGCEGKVVADLRVLGNLNDIESLWPEGTVDFDNWVIFANQRIVAKDVNGVLAVRKRSLDLGSLYGAICKGSFNGSFYLGLKRQSPVAYGGDALAAGVDMAELTDILRTTKNFTRGTGLLSIRFTGDAGGIESVRGNGAVFLNDADLGRFPVIGELFKSIDAWKDQIGDISDAEIAFGLSGLGMTIERGHLSNRFSAIEAEQGGKINLQNGQIDVYVVAAPLKKVDRIINSVPVVNWFAHFKDKLIRLRLKGHWSEPAGKLISKQPIKDLKEATVGFVVDIARSGGHFTEKLKKGFGFDRTNDKPKDK